MEIPAIVKMVVVTKKLIGHVDPIHRTAGTNGDLGDRFPSIFGIIVFPISDRVGRRGGGQICPTKHKSGGV